jgi:RNA polymerase sigma-70 factor (ECF subfamily)
MDEGGRAKLESEIRGLCERGDHAGAATRLLQGYGPEVYGLLVAVHRNEVDASEAFSDLALAVWSGLPRFAWQSSARTWAYAIARNVLRTRKRDAARRHKRAGSADTSAIEAVVEQVRTGTAAFLRTEKRTRLEALRDSLPEEDRMLLVLRIDRRLPWNDLARVLHDGAEDEPLGEAEIAKEAARLRKRFQLVKDRLRKMAEEEGLLE